MVENNRNLQSTFANSKFIFVVAAPWGCSFFRVNYQWKSTISIIILQIGNAQISEKQQEQYRLEYEADIKGLIENKKSKELSPSFKIKSQWKTLHAMYAQGYQGKYIENKH